MTLTTKDLVRTLCEHGYTKREARVLTQSLFRAIVRQLRARQPVRLPFGTLSVEKSPPPYRIRTFGTIVERYSKPYRVIFRPHKEDSLDE